MSPVVELVSILIAPSALPGKQSTGVLTGSRGGDSFYLDDMDIHLVSGEQQESGAGRHTLSLGGMMGV